MVGSRW